MAFLLRMLSPDLSLSAGEMIPCFSVRSAQAKSRSFDVHGSNLGDMMNISFAPNISLQVCDCRHSSRNVHCACLCVCFGFVRFSFFSTMPRDWLPSTSPK